MQRFLSSCRVQPSLHSRPGVKRGATVVFGLARGACDDTAPTLPCGNSSTPAAPREAPAAAPGHAVVMSTPLPPATLVPAATSPAPLVDLVLDGLSSEHSRRAYRRALNEFFTWYPSNAAGERVLTTFV